MRLIIIKLHNKFLPIQSTLFIILLNISKLKFTIERCTNHCRLLPHNKDGIDCTPVDIRAITHQSVVETSINIW